MRSQISLLQVIGSFWTFAALGFLVPIFTHRGVAGIDWGWLIAPLLLVQGLGRLAGRFNPQFKPTRLQWLGISVLWLVLFMGGYLLSSHGTNLLGAVPIVFVIVIIFGMQLWSSRSQKSSAC